MTEEPTYLDRLRHVNELLRSMESDFLAILGEHETGKSGLVGEDEDPSSAPSKSKVTYPMRLIRRVRENRISKPTSTRRQADRQGWPSCWWADWPRW